MRLKCLVITIALCGIAQCDEPQTIKLQKAPKSVAEALQRFGEDTKAADGVLSKAEAEWSANIDKLEALLIDQLKQIAKQHAAGGEIAKASDAWVEVLRVDAKNRDAMQYFRAIGRLDVVQKQIARGAKSKTNAPRRVLFRAEGGRTFKRLANGQWADSHKSQIHAEVSRDSTTVVIRAPDGTEHLFLDNGFLYGSRKDRTGTDEHIWREAGKGEWLR